MRHMEARITAIAGPARALYIFYLIARLQQDAIAGRCCRRNQPFRVFVTNRLRRHIRHAHSRPPAGALTSDVLALDSPSNVGPRSRNTGLNARVS